MLIILLHYFFTLRESRFFSVYINSHAVILMLALFLFKNNLKTKRKKEAPVKEPPSIRTLTERFLVDRKRILIA